MGASAKEQDDLLKTTILVVDGSNKEVMAENHCRPILSPRSTTVSEASRLPNMQGFGTSLRVQSSQSCA
jgi:hypothetical protein